MFEPVKTFQSLISCWQLWRTHSVNNDFKCFRNFRLYKISSCHVPKIHGSKAFKKLATALSIAFCRPYYKGNQFFTSPLGEFVTRKIIGLHFCCVLGWNAQYMHRNSTTWCSHTFSGLLYLLLMGWSHAHTIKSVFFLHRGGCWATVLPKKAKKALKERQTKREEVEL